MEVLDCGHERPFAQLVTLWPLELAEPCLAGGADVGGVGRKERVQVATRAHLLLLLGMEAGEHRPAQWREGRRRELVHDAGGAVAGCRTI